MSSRTHSFPLKPSERRSLENIRAMLYGRKTKQQEKSARREEPQQPKKKRKTDLSKVIIAQYLYDEGYADSLRSAEIMSESISEQWSREILEK